ncbi:hypothetical protein [Streptomyces sp. URMC 129]|uniref:hypothetical protein n=1 Tax=Streptomyces sp. URMC 129 TaxID=3423407 RepID=UPI003F1A0FF9
MGNQHKIAARRKLEYLIKRRRLEDAKLVAEQARYRTVPYGEHSRQYLEVTRRDARRVDWEHEVSRLLEEALDHIEGRYRHENTILSTITAHRDETPDHWQGWFGWRGRYITALGSGRNRRLPRGRAIGDAFGAFGYQAVLPGLGEYDRTEQDAAGAAALVDGPRSDR